MIEELRQRLLFVLRERVAELEDDLAREANRRATAWDGAICNSCGEEVFRLLDGQCIACRRDADKRLAEAQEAKQKEAAGRLELRQQARRDAAELYEEGQGPRLKQVPCYRCRGPAVMVVLGTGVKVKIVCSACGSYWI